MLAGQCWTNCHCRLWQHAGSTCLALTCSRHSVQRLPFGPGLLGTPMLFLHHLRRSAPGTVHSAGFCMPSRGVHTCSRCAYPISARLREGVCAAQLVGLSTGRKNSILLLSRCRRIHCFVPSSAAQTGGGERSHAVQICPVHAAIQKEAGVWNKEREGSAQMAQSLMCHTTPRKIWRFRSSCSSPMLQWPGCLCKVSTLNRNLDVSLRTATATMHCHPLCWVYDKSFLLMQGQTGASLLRWALHIPLHRTAAAIHQQELPL